MQLVSIFRDDASIFLARAQAEGAMSQGVRAAVLRSSAPEQGAAACRTSTAVAEPTADYAPVRGSGPRAARNVAESPVYWDPVGSIELSIRPD